MQTFEGCVQEITIASSGECMCRHVGMFASMSLAFNTSLSIYVITCAHVHVRMSIDFSLAINYLCILGLSSSVCLNSYM